MKPIDPIWFALLYLSSEIVISTMLRSRTDSSDTDKQSLRLIWGVVTVSVVLALLAARFIPSAAFDGRPFIDWMGFGLFVFGLLLRWYAIAYLGKYFTVNVQVTSDQKVIDTGPYRYIRHPSYLGALLAFAGLGLCFHNLATLLFFTVPTTAVFLHRIRIEEAALSKGIGEAYVRYVARTKRLLPGIY